jgi:rfaE bifunctional protein kinase chain/domain
MIKPPSQSRYKELTKNFSAIKGILVVGDSGIDKYTHGEVTRISPEAPVPIVNVMKEWLKLGLSSNINHNLATLKVNSTVCTVVGEDRNASVFESLLEESNIKTWGVIRDAGRMTTFKERVVTQVQQICRVDYESTTPIDSKVEDRLLQRFAEFLPEHSAVILEDYNKGVLTERVISQVIKLCREKGIMVALDPARGRKASLYKRANLLKPNFTEAKMLVESLGHTEKDVRKICQILLESLELDAIALTLGADGMATMEKSGINSFQMIPTAATEVFDVSGAGDTVISLLVSTLLAGGNLAEAAWLANCGAGVVVSKKGTAVVTFEELERFHKRLLERF